MAVAVDSCMAVWSLYLPYFLFVFVNDKDVEISHLQPTVIIIQLLLYATLFLLVELFAIGGYF